MDTRTKRRWQLGCLAFLTLLLVLCIYPQYQNNASATLLLPENSDLPNLRLPKGEIITGWEKEDTLYFFLPSYVSLDRLSLGRGLKWADTCDNTLRYDITRTVFLRPNGGAAEISKKICFKHSSNVYTIFMDLKGNTPDAITKDGFIETEITVFSPDGNTNCHAASGLVKGRGNSTWELDKKPYYLKLSEKAGLCGLDPGKNWILLANAYEATKLSNKLLYDFSKAAGLHYSVDSEWADLYINGEYRGNYLVCEKIEVRSQVVDIANLEKENEKVYQSCEPFVEEYQRGFLTDQSPSNITGGYLLEKDTTIADSPCGFITDGDKCFVIKSPNNASLEEVSYIRSCFQNIEDLMREQDERLLQHIDADSFARRYLIEEIALNSDAFITSCFYYKERNNDKIYAGPVWDYDAVLGESNTIDYEELGNVWLNYDETTVLSMGDYRSTIAVLNWEADFQSIPAYMDVVKQAYKDMQPQLEDLLYHRIDAAAAHVKQAVALDSFRWNYAESHAGHYTSFDNNIRYMKFYLAKRMNFLNRKFGMEELVYEDTADTLHEITCITESGEIEFSVMEGALLHTDDLPEYDTEKYAGWIYEWDRTPVSEYLPIYEDMTLLLDPLPETE